MQSSEKSEEEIWVEADRQSMLKNSDKQKDEGCTGQTRDEWMSSPAILPTYTKEVKKDKSNQDKCMLDQVSSFMFSYDNTYIKQFMNFHLRTY